MGASNELKTNGYPWPTVATVGDWRALAFKGHVDLTPELDRDLSKMLIEVDDIDADL